MTVIVYDGQTLAVDSGIYNGIRTGHVKKI